MFNWAYFPQSDCAPEIARRTIDALKECHHLYSSESNEVQVSDEVLAKMRKSLEALGFQVETGKKKDQKIRVPVLFGTNGAIEKSFDADAVHHKCRFVLEVEAGRAVANNQFLKDLFQACMMQQIDYLGIAVRNRYRSSNDFERVFTFFDTLYKSRRLQLPLKGILIVGY